MHVLRRYGATAVLALASCLSATALYSPAVASPAKTTPATASLSHQQALAAGRIAADYRVLTTSLTQDVNESATLFVGYYLTPSPTLQQSVFHVIFGTGSATAKSQAHLRSELSRSNLTIQPMLFTIDLQALAAQRTHNNQLRTQLAEAITTYDKLGQLVARNQPDDKTPRWPLVLSTPHGTVRGQTAVRLASRLAAGIYSYPNVSKG